MASRGCGDPASVVSIAIGEGVIDELLEGDPGTGAVVLRLLHHDVDHIELGIDAKIGAAAAVPFEFANRSRRRWFCPVAPGGSGGRGAWRAFYSAQLFTC